MKKIIKVLLICAIMLFALSITASAETEGYYTYTVSDGKATITAVDKSISGEIIIPETLGGYPVTIIGDYAFLSCNKLKGVKIPGSISEINYGAFAACNKLTNLEICNGVTIIGNSAFSYCSSLKCVEIPKSVVEMGSCVFDHCTALEELIIPFVGDKRGNKKTEKDVFGYLFANQIGQVEDMLSAYEVIQYYNLGLWKIYYIPKSLKKVTVTDEKTIGYGVFGNCTELTEIVIDDSVTYIERNAFTNTKWYNDQPDGILYVGKVLYEYKGEMPKETSVIVCEGTKSISGYAFYAQDGLINIEIPDSVTTVGEYAFYDTTWYENQLDGVVYAGKVLYGYKGKMPKNTKITIKEGTKSISQYAFCEYINLEKMEIPKSLIKIGNGAFDYCTKLETVYYHGNESEWGTIEVESNNYYLLNANIIFSSKPAEVEFKNYGDEPVKAFFVTYGAKSKMLDVVQKTIENTQKETVVVDSKTEKYKILYWENLSNLKPVYAPIEKEL